MRRSSSLVFPALNQFQQTDLSNEGRGHVCSGRLSTCHVLRRPLSRLTETCLHSRPGSVINFKPSSYLEVCLLGVNTDSLLNIASAVLDQLISNSSHIPDITSPQFCRMTVKRLLITASPLFDRFAFLIWYPLVVKTWTEVIRMVGVPRHPQRRYHSSRLTLLQVRWWSAVHSETGSLVWLSALLSISVSHTQGFIRCSIFFNNRNHSGHNIKVCFLVQDFVEQMEEKFTCLHLKSIKNTACVHIMCHSLLSYLVNEYIQNTKLKWMHRHIKLRMSWLMNQESKYLADKNILPQKNSSSCSCRVRSPPSAASEFCPVFWVIVIKLYSMYKGGCTFIDNYIIICSGSNVPSLLYKQYDRHLYCLMLQGISS